MGKKILVLATLLVMSIFAFYFVYTYVIAKPAVDPTLVAIINDPSIQNSTKDMTNNLGVQSADDIGFTKQQDGGIKVRYGKQDFFLSKGQWDDPTIKSALDKMNLTVTQNKNGVIFVKYNGVKVKEWVNTN